MKKKILLSTFLFISLSACSRDPLVHGPFLIGAHPEPIRDGVCCPASEVRSQHARELWEPCRNSPGVCAIGAVSPPVYRAEIIAPTIDIKTTPVPSTPRVQRPRSAWDY